MPEQLIVSDLLVPVDGKTLDWPRRAARAINRLLNLLPSLATLADLENAMADKDTDGNPVPTYRAQTYTYDGSGNRQTETVTNGTDTWVKTYGYSGGQLLSDSGWVKQ